MKLKLKEKLKGTASNTFNTLSGKKGWRAALSGGLMVAFAGVGIGAAVATAPLSGAAMLPLVTIFGINTYNAAKAHEKKGPKL